MKLVLAAAASLLVASTDARRLSALFNEQGVGYSKAGKSSSPSSSPSEGQNRLKDLEADFPCLGDLVNETVVDQYVEKDNTSMRSTGLISELNGETDCFCLRTEYSQSISKSEMKLMCATKCENVLDDCTTFMLTEDTNPMGETRYRCTFYTDDSKSVHFPVVNPVISITNRTTAFEYSYSVFYKGDDLVLPEFQGCDVPVGKALDPAIVCRLAQLQYDETGSWPSALVPREICLPVLASLTSDFNDYILPSVTCTLTFFGGDTTKLTQCLGCLAKTALGCNSGPVCGDKDNIITKKCPDTCTSSGQAYECKTCGNVCPDEETCVAKIQTALLCSAGANPKFDQEEQLGSCLNSDITGFPNYLADEGNGDFKCLTNTAMPDWI